MIKVKNKSFATYPVSEIVGLYGKTIIVVIGTPQQVWLKWKAYVKLCNSCKGGTK